MRPNLVNKHTRIQQMNKISTSARAQLAPKFREVPEIREHVEKFENIED